MEKEKVQKGECLAFYFTSITKKCSHSGLGGQGPHTKKILPFKQPEILFLAFSRRHLGLKKMKTTFTILYVYYLSSCAKFNQGNHRIMINRLESTI